MNFTERLARATSRRPWLTVGIWGVALVVSMVVVVLLLGSALQSERALPGTDSYRAIQLLDERFPETGDPSEFILVRSPTLTVDDSAFRQRVEELTEQGEATGGPVSITNTYRDPELAPVSDDKHATLIAIVMPADETEAEEKIEPMIKLAEEADGQDGFEVFITGEATSERDLSVLSEEDLQNGELFFGLPASLVVLVLVFGAVVGALMPLMLALVAIVVALALAALLGQIFDLSLFIVNMLTGMGLALGIDYSLFVLSRYREERARGHDKLEAIWASGATSSRAVFVSGSVFVLALLGMLLVPDSILRSLALGAILVGIVAVIAALTLMPAVLTLLGDHVNSLRVPVIGRSIERGGTGEGRFWAWVARSVMARPVVSLVVAVSLLLAAAIPVLDFRIGDTGIAAYPNDLPSKAGVLALEQSFPGASVEPADIVVDGDIASPEVQAAIERLRTSLESKPGFGPPDPARANDAEDLALISVPVLGDAEGEAAGDAVRELRETTIPEAFAGVDANVYVAGPTADAIDSADVGERWLPIVFAFVLGLSFVLLVVAFRSIVVPIKAIVLNLISVGAAYGLMVLVFQKGVGADLLGFTEIDRVASWVPLFLFSVLFGLSMDYHVFLLSRIRERFTQTRSNTEAVAYGVSSTARLITGAALIMVAVFTGFAIGDLVMFQQMGFGLAVALIIDATIVRSVLVPASMQLLGERNWYLPSWLEWLPHLEMEGPPGEPRPAAPTSAR